MSLQIDEGAGLVENGHRLYGRLTPVGWSPPEDKTLTFGEWEQTGQVITTLYNASKFARGDWLLYGEGEYGERFAQAIDATHLNSETLRAEAWVSGAVNPVLRKTDLSWSHHQTVSALSEEEQEYWLDLAAEEGIGANDLRERIRAKRIAEAGGISAAEVHGFFARVTRDCLTALHSAEELGGITRLADGLSREDRIGVAVQMEGIMEGFGRWVETLRDHD